MFRGIRLPKDWRSVEDSVVVLQHNVTPLPNNTGESSFKIAGFDFDDTLVRKHDNTLAFPSVMDKLRELHCNGYQLAIFSNEALDHLKSPKGIESILTKKLKRLEHFVKQVDVPFHVFVATRYDRYRKPSTSDALKKKPPGGNEMWLLMVEMLGLTPEDIDMESSIYVGDSAGGLRDFSDADSTFARVVGVKFALAKDFFGKNAVQTTTTTTKAVQTTTIQSADRNIKRVKTVEVDELKEEDDDECQIVETKQVRTEVNQDSEDECQIVESITVDKIQKEPKQMD